MESNPASEAVALLRASTKFREWKPAHIRAIGTTPGIEKSSLMKEHHYTPDELAELWAVSTETIRSIFREEPGVLKIGKTGGKYRRGYVTLRIPADVAERVHTRLSA